MHLIYSTQELRLGGRPSPGFPILLYEDMSSSQEANEFLRHYLSRGSIGSKRSWAPIAQALYDFFGFLEAHHLHWKDVDRGEAKSLVATYRDYCFEIANLARNTIRHRLLYVCAFYEYAQRQKWIHKLPYDYQQITAPRRQGFFAHLDTSGGRHYMRSVMPRKHKDIKKFLSKDQVILLLSAVKNPHHRTIIRMALQSGLRRVELATFPTSYIFDPDKAGTTERNIRIMLDPSDGSGMKTKGNKARVILIDRRLMKDLHHYLVHLRGERAALNPTPSKELFLNQNGQPWADGGKGIEVIVRRIGERVGIKAWPHMLRHTYATHTLSALQRQRNNSGVDPIIFLQKQLGHASITTTMEYLHLMTELADDAVLIYNDELNEWAGEQP